MQIITAGRTGPNRSVRFGGDPDLDPRGRRDVLVLSASLTRPIDICGPEAATRATAEILGATGGLIVDDALRTLDVGAWSGLSPEEIDSVDLGGWFTDPEARPHGGESVAQFVDRVHAWRAGQAEHGDGYVVVAMPVAQALLCVDADGFFAREVRPATLYTCTDAR
ncbi:histidine phosphatase family protein [Gordonia terrae]|uniref:histidine phosphatase family protein n=1 Tax=Gordonia hongkongensis TaxID=1701090 RepID=UPI0022B3EB30|nr:histidine phosphatase family protein [Gordonia terrae]